jgi:hypothetical protein
MTTPCIYNEKCYRLDILHHLTYYHGDGMFKNRFDKIIEFYDNNPKSSDFIIHYNKPDNIFKYNPREHFCMLIWTLKNMPTMSKTEKTKLLKYYTQIEEMATIDKILLTPEKNNIIKFNYKNITFQKLWETGLNNTIMLIQLS